MQPVEIALTDVGCELGFQAITFAKNQPEYLPLPALSDGHKVITKWKFTKEELEEILITGELYLKVLTFGDALQPLQLATNLEEIL